MGFVSMHSLLMDSRFVFGAFIPSLFLFVFWARCLRVCQGIACFNSKVVGSVGYMKKSSSCVVLMGIAGSEFILRNGG